MIKLNSYLVVLLITFEYEVIAKDWSCFRSLEGGAQHVAASSWGPGRLDVFAVAPDGKIFQKAFTYDTWAKDWGALGGATAKKPSAFSREKNQIDVMYTGYDKKIYHKTWNGKIWSNWKVSPNGGLFSSGPSLACHDRTDLTLHVFVIGVDTQLYHCQIDRYGDWTKWESWGGSAVGDPAAVSWFYTRLDVFVISSDKRLWQKTLDGKTWIDWRLVISDKFFKPGVGAVSKSDEKISVFLTGEDDSMYHCKYENGKWDKPVNLGGKIKSSPAATSPGSARVDVFVVGISDSKVYQNFLDEAKLVNAANQKFGCYKAYCWTRCSTTAVSSTKPITDGQWCYTTATHEIGTSQNFKYAKCENDSQCRDFWNCAGSCTY